MESLIRETRREEDETVLKRNVKRSSSASWHTFLNFWTSVSNYEENHINSLSRLVKCESRNLKVIQNNAKFNMTSQED